MRIGEAADRLSLNPQTIRYYERRGLLPAPERTASGYRVYDEADIERLTFIRTAQRLGITLDEIGEILALRDQNRTPCGYVRGVLQAQVADIGQRIAELEALRDQLIALDQLADQLHPQPGTCQLIDHVRETESDS